jgi:Glyoxalase/Bleomycin resistance protein/Dioxygenase superfamily
MDGIGTKEFMQICFVVKDAEKAMENYKEIFGIETGTLKEIPPPDRFKTYYHGKEISTKTKYYVFKMGNLVIELTQPDEADSVWKEVLDKNGEGLCYLGVMVGDSERAVEFLEKRGSPRIHHGGTPESNYNIVDTRESLGCLLNVKMQK